MYGAAGCAGRGSGRRWDRNCVGSAHRERAKELLAATATSGVMTTAGGAKTSR